MLDSQQGVCIECGCTLMEHYPTCLHQFERVIVVLSNQMRWRGEMRMAMDAYALQHVEQFCPHRRSVAVHLMGLCWGLEWKGETRVARAMQRWLETQPTIPELPPPFLTPFQEVINVGDALRHFDRGDEEQFVDHVREWARSVWQSWHEHHRVVRIWISNAVSRYAKDE